MEPMEVDVEGERRKDKKKHKKAKKAEEDGAATEEGRRERRKEKKERKKSKRRQRSEEAVAEMPGAGGSPSWTATGATIPNAVEQLLNDTNTVQTDQANAANNHQQRAHHSESSSRTEPAAPAGGAAQAAGDELSIEKTNKLRAALGLKPLQVAGAPGDAAAAATKKEDVHAPPTNIAHVKKAAKVKERLDTVKTKQQLEKKIRATKGLAEASDEEESAESWVERNRRVVEARRQAELQAEMQRRADGVQDDEEEERQARPHLPYYAAGELRGLKVEHDVGRFREGQDIVLTLKDTGVLEESEGDVLMSTALREEEKLEKNLENRKKKPLYNPYEDADALHRPALLKKYDEVIGGERQGQFVLDTGGRAQAAADARAETAAGTPFRADMLQTLLTSSQTLARDFYNEEEMAGKFKKVKKSARSRRQAAVKDEPVGQVPEESTGGGAVEDEADDVELQLALSRARRLRQQEYTGQVGADTIESQLQRNDNTLDIKVEGRVFLDATSEFCRTVGALSMDRAGGAGRAVKEEVVEAVGGGEDEDADMAEDMEIEEEDKPEEKKGGWSEVQFEAEPANLGSDPEDEHSHQRGRQRRPRPNSGKSSHVQSILDDEPTAGRGVGSTLVLAMRKGLIDEAAEAKKQALLRSNRRGSKSSVPPQNYTVEDKIIDDDKRGRHERYAGPLVAFKERPGYVPGFKLAYHDHEGRLLDQKSAFRDLSHKFHGKGSGKMKTEKRTKKFNEAKLLLEMSSVDTPLGTVAKMKAKQAEQATPFLLLSGANAKASANAHLHTPTPLSKKS